MELEQKIQSYLNNVASYFKKSKSHSIGIDFGNNSLKIVELEKKDGKIKLKNYALVEMRDDLSEKDLRLFSGQIVLNILKGVSMKKKDFNIAIPSHSSFITLIEVSGQTEAEIKGEVEYAASKYIPVDLSEVIFDWQIVEASSILSAETEKKNERKISSKTKTDEISKKSKVLLVSIMKNVSSEFQKAFNDNNLSIDSIEVGCFSLQRSLLCKDDKNYLIVDIGKRITNIIGIYKGQLLFNRNIDLAGDQITKLMAKSLNVSFDRAEKLKKEKGFESDSKIVVKNILEPVFDSIMKEALDDLEKFEEFKSNSIDQIILSGGTSAMIGVKAYVEKKMKKEVILGNPWSKIEYSKEIGKNITAMRPFFAVATGLALVNLLDD